MCRGWACAAPCPPGEGNGGRGRSSHPAAIPSRADPGETPRHGPSGTRGMYPAGIPPSVPASPLAPAMQQQHLAIRAPGKAVGALLLLSQVCTDTAVAGLWVCTHSCNRTQLGGNDAVENQGRIHCQDKALTL